MNQHDYITLRIINACLRENVADLIAQGNIRREEDGCWLYASHLRAPLRLRLRDSDYMQPWVAETPAWQERHQDAWLDRQGYADWLDLLMPTDDDDARALYRNYREEADAACEQGELCRQAFARLADLLATPPADRDWGERLRHADQIASYLDHPYYPTARAKFGFSATQLTQYAPEFCQPFSLRWLALPRTALTLLNPDARPGWWPSFHQVGLPETLAQTHELLPVHPLTWTQLDTLPAQAVAAPEPCVSVYPTLSVRTVQLAEHPGDHLKMPLAMRTLGQKNIRLIKPSTLYDGQWFAEVLPLLAQQDPLLQGRYRHVDEAFCGHLGEEKLFAFLLRRYPSPVAGETLAPVAALGADMPDGRPYVCAVLDQPGMPSLASWWREYCQLMADVHLTLWLRYGIALESNQQNAILSFTPHQPLSLMMKDNDAARLWPSRFSAARPDLYARLAALRDDRIRVDDEQALAQMFMTITVQLDLAAVLENLAGRGLIERASAYQTLRDALATTLAQLEQQGTDTAYARQVLFDDPRQPVKYLLQSGSLLSKQASGAADINKYYGYSGPNFLRRDAI
ncbi:IucA/IucC family protein [Musicola keenii]|uniref:IucA/IucC family protein n=1 Tax=Musicola keenii TaxID=2884250 RepID=UPI00177C5B1B|nr:IucA/IucC family protein [Musicola keenii]